MCGIESELSTLTLGPLFILFGELSNILGANFRRYLIFKHEEVVKAGSHVPASDAVERSDLLFFELVVGGCKSQQKSLVLLGLLIATGEVDNASIVISGIKGRLTYDELNKLHVRLY